MRSSGRVQKLVSRKKAKIGRTMHELFSYGQASLYIKLSATGHAVAVSRCAAVTNTGTALNSCTHATRVMRQRTAVHRRFCAVVRV